MSVIAAEMARRLAAQRNVNMCYEIADLLSDHFSVTIEPVDWLVAIFVQFVGPTERPRRPFSADQYGCSQTNDVNLADFYCFLD